MARPYEQALYDPSEDNEPLLGSSVQSWRIGLVTESLPIDSPLNGLQIAADCDISGPGNLRSRGSFLNYGNGELPGLLISNFVSFIRDGHTYLAGAFVPSVDSTAAEVYFKQGEDGNWMSVGFSTLENPRDQLHLTRYYNYIVLTGGRVNDDGNSMQIFDITDEDGIQIYQIHQLDNPDRVIIDESSGLATDSSDITYTYAITLSPRSPFEVETQISPIRSVSVRKPRSQWDGVNEKVFITSGNRQVFILTGDSNASPMELKSFNIDDLITGDDTAGITTIGDMPNTDRFLGLTENAQNNEEFYTLNTTRGELWRISLTDYGGGDLLAPYSAVRYGDLPAGLDSPVSITGRDDGDIFVLESNGDIWLINPRNPSSTAGDYGMVNNLDSLPDLGDINTTTQQARLAFRRGHEAEVGGGAYLVYQTDGTDNSLIIYNLSDDIEHGGINLRRWIVVPRSVYSFPRRDLGGASFSYDGRLHLSFGRLAIDVGAIFGRDPDVVDGTAYTAKPDDIEELDEIPAEYEGAKGASFSLPRTPMSGVSRAGSYNVYIGRTETDLTLLKSGLREPVFVDRGVNLTGDPDFNRPAPRGNGSIIPLAKRSIATRGRLLLYGDPDRPVRVYYSGFESVNSDDKFDFSGGDVTLSTSGFIDVTTSTDEEIVSIEPFYGHSDINGLHVFTRVRGAASGKEYFLRPYFAADSNGRRIDSYSVEEISRTGAEGALSVVNYQDNLYWPTLDGFKVKGPRPALQNLVLTDDISQTVRLRALALSQEALNSAVGTTYRQKVYWAMPEWDRDYEGKKVEPPEDQPTKFNKIWVLNLTQGEGSWICDWNVQCDYIYTHVSGDGRQLLLAVRGNKIFKYIDDDYSENFLPKAKSSRIFIPSRQFNEINKVAIMAIVQPWLIISGLTGRIRITLWGRTEENIEGELGQIEVEAGNVIYTSGSYGAFVWGRNAFGEQPPTVIKEDGGDEDVYYIPVELEESQAIWIGFTIEVLTPETNFILNDFMFTYKYAGPVGTDDGIQIDPAQTSA